MLFIDQSIERIRRFVRRRKVSKAALARAAGLHPNTLRELHLDGWDPRLSTIRKLEDYIDGQPTAREAA